MVKDCKSCIHQRVCKHCKKYEQYQNEMKVLIEKWGIDNPFNFSTDCPEYHAKEVQNLKSNNTEKDNFIKAWNERVPFLPIKDTPQIRYDYNSNPNDEITTTVEEGLRSVGKTSEEYKEEAYNFLKELQKISMKNKIYFI